MKKFMKGARFALIALLSLITAFAFISCEPEPEQVPPADTTDYSYAAFIKAWNDAGKDPAKMSTEPDWAKIGDAIAVFNENEDGVDAAIIGGEFCITFSNGDLLTQHKDLTWTLTVYVPPVDYSYSSFAREYDAQKDNLENFTTKADYTTLSEETFKEFKAAAEADHTEWTIFQSEGNVVIHLNWTDSLTQKAGGKWTFSVRADYRWQTFNEEFEAHKDSLATFKTAADYTEMDEGDFTTFKNTAEKAHKDWVVSKTEDKFVIEMDYTEILKQSKGGAWAYTTRTDYRFSTFISLWDTAEHDVTKMSQDIDWTQIGDAITAFNEAGKDNHPAVSAASDGSAFTVTFTSPNGILVIKQDSNKEWSEVSRESTISELTVTKIYIEGKDDKKNAEDEVKFIAVTNTGDAALDLGQYCLVNVQEKDTYKNRLPEITLEKGATIYLANGWHFLPVYEAFPNIGALPYADVNDTVSKTAVTEEYKIYDLMNGTLQLARVTEFNSSGKPWHYDIIDNVITKSGTDTAHISMVRNYNLETRKDNGWTNAEKAEMDAERLDYSYDLFKENWKNAALDAAKMPKSPQYTDMTTAEAEAFTEAALADGWLSAGVDAVSEDFVMKKTEHITLTQSKWAGGWTYEDSTPPDYTFTTFQTAYEANKADLTNLPAVPVYKNMDETAFGLFKDAAESAYPGWKVMRDETYFIIELSSENGMSELLKQDASGIWSVKSEEYGKLGSLAITRFAMYSYNKMIAIRNMTDAPISLDGWKIVSQKNDSISYQNALPPVTLEAGKELFVLSSNASADFSNLVNVSQLPVITEKSESFPTIPTSMAYRGINFNFNDDDTVELWNGNEPMDQVIIDGNKIMQKKTGAERVWDETDLRDRGFRKVESLADLDSERIALTYDLFKPLFDQNGADLTKMPSAPWWWLMTPEEVTTFNGNSDGLTASTDGKTFTLSFSFHILTQDSKGWKIMNDYSFDSFWKAYDEDRENLSKIPTDIMFSDMADDALSAFNRDASEITETAITAEKTADSFIVRLVTESGKQITTLTLTQAAAGTWSKATETIDKPDFSYATFKDNWTTAGGDATNMSKAINYTLMSSEDLRLFNEDTVAVADGVSANNSTGDFVVTFKNRDTLTQSADSNWAFVKYVVADYSYDTFIKAWTASNNDPSAMAQNVNNADYTKIGDALAAFNTDAGTAAYASLTADVGDFRVDLANGDVIQQLAKDKTWTYRARTREVPTTAEPAKPSKTTYDTTLTDPIAVTEIMKSGQARIIGLSNISDSAVDLSDYWYSTPKKTNLTPAADNVYALPDVTLAPGRTLYIFDNNYAVPADYAFLTNMSKLIEVKADSTGTLYENAFIYAPLKLSSKAGYLIGKGTQHDSTEIIDRFTAKNQIPDSKFYIRLRSTSDNTSTGWHYWSKDAYSIAYFDELLLLRK